MIYSLHVKRLLHMPHVLRHTMFPSTKNRFGKSLWSVTSLTHLPLVPHICVSKPGQHYFRQWLIAYSAPSHYLNQCWIIVILALKNKLQWNFNQNKTFHSEKCIWTYRLRNGVHFVQGRWVYVRSKWQDYVSQLRRATSVNDLRLIVRRAGLFWSQQDFEWWWSVPLSSASPY